MSEEHETSECGGNGVAMAWLIALIGEETVKMPVISVNKTGGSCIIDNLLAAAAACFPGEGALVISLSIASVYVASEAAAIIGGNVVNEMTMTA